MSLQSLKLILGSTTSVEVELLSASGSPDVFVGNLVSTSLALYETSDAAAAWTSSGGSPTLVGNILSIPVSLSGLVRGKYIGQVSVALTSGSFKTAKFDVEVL